MDAKTAEIRYQRWVQVIQEWSNSGLSNRDYCQQNAIDEKQLKHLAPCAKKICRMAAKKTDTKGVVVALTDVDARKKALEVALGKIEKDFGKGSVMKLGENLTEKVDVIPTGSLSVDAALGVGGLPRGRIVEVYGPESTGKTTLALHAVAQAQKLGGTAAFIDAEHALDPVYAGKLGVDINELYVSQPDNGEQALDICEALVRSGAIDIVVVDSVAALVPKAEIEGDMGDSHVGLQARLMSQALRKLTSVISKTNTVVIFINQLREKVGVMYGNPETTTGGKALKLYATIRIDVRKSEAIKEGKEIIGNRTKITIKKNKVAPPFRGCVVDMLYGEGISRTGEVLDFAVEMELIKKSGSFYSYNGERMNDAGEARLEDVARSFAAFYEDRLAHGLPAEKKNCIFTKGGYSQKDVERLILSMPFKRYEDMHIMHHSKHLGTLQFYKTLVRQLTDEDYAAIRESCHADIARYFGTAKA